MVHDFAITERHLVFVLVPLRFDMSRMQATTPGNSPGPSFMDSLKWDDSGSVHVLLVGKDSLQVEHRFELPPFFLFHLGNAWQDRDTVRIEVAVAPGFDSLMRDIMDATAGRRVEQDLASSSASEITLNLAKGTANMQQLPTQGVDFPRFDQRFTGQQTNHLFMLGASPTLPAGTFGLNSVTALDRAKSREQTFDYGAEMLAEEHVFVPGPTGQSGSGWLVGTAYNWRQQRTVLSVFNAQQIADGPVAQATMPYGLPMGLHGQYATQQA
jgi:carotenoid cleavage dioxygenase